MMQETLLCQFGHDQKRLLYCKANCHLCTCGVLFAMVHACKQHIAIACTYQCFFSQQSCACCVMLTLVCRPLIQTADELEPQESGLRISTGKAARQSTQGEEAVEPTSASGFYSPTNSYGNASPAGKPVTQLLWPVPVML